MNNLDRLIKAEGVQGGVLAEYENRFRRFVDVRVDSGDNPMNLSEIGHKLLQAARFLAGDYHKTEPYALYRLCMKAAAAHLVLTRT